VVEVHQAEEDSPEAVAEEVRWAEDSPEVVAEEEDKIDFKHCILHITKKKKSIIINLSFLHERANSITGTRAEN
jgi:hypothetical protein